MSRPADLGVAGDLTFDESARGIRKCRRQEERSGQPDLAADGAVRPGWSALHGRWTSSIGSVAPTALLPL